MSLKALKVLKPPIAYKILVLHHSNNIKLLHILQKKKQVTYPTITNVVKYICKSSMTAGSNTVTIL